MSSFHKDLATLQKHGAALLTPTEETLRRLPIAAVQISDVFQPRQDVTETAEHGKHLAELIRALQAQKALKPIVVLKVNDVGWVCIDGFHRLSAYAEAGGRRTHIPVVVFRGSINDALRFSIAENTPDKLNMSLADKREAAFRMVVRGVYSQSEISQAAGVSESTVDRMRSGLAKVRTAHPGVAWEEHTWINVKWTLRGRKGGSEMWKDKRAQQVAAGLAKHFQGIAKDQPDVFADGLILHDLDAAEAIAQKTLEKAARVRAGMQGDPGDF